MIPVTKPYLPAREKLDRYIDGIYERGWLTNNGQLVQELTGRLETYLGVRNLLLVSNGTLALQVAYRALGLTDHESAERPEAITTPFSFVATASSLVWEGISPVFADIDADTWCLDPSNIEKALTSRTRAIVPVHVFGNACEVEAIDEIGQRRGLQVIYDAAHAFGVNYKGKSLLGYGDASTLSFHATKLFHTVEGGAIVFREAADLERAKKLINFGITGPESIEGLGINAKMNEFQAAMGLCVLDEMDNNLQEREAILRAYREALADRYVLQKMNPDANNNFAYVPILLESEIIVKRVQAALKEIGVYTRRYFYPSLDTVGYLEGQPISGHSNQVARRVLCLPIYVGLTREDVTAIVNVIDEVASS